MSPCLVALRVSKSQREKFKCMHRRKMFARAAGETYYNHKDSCKITVTRAKTKQHARTREAHVWTNMFKLKRSSATT